MDDFRFFKMAAVHHLGFVLREYISESKEEEVMGEGIGESEMEELVPE